MDPQTQTTLPKTRFAEEVFKTNPVIILFDCQASHGNECVTNKNKPHRTSAGGLPMAPLMTFGLVTPIFFTDCSQSY